MGDLISRQAVIDATKGPLMITGSQNAEAVAEYLRNFIEKIEALPSIQGEIINCKYRTPCGWCELNNVGCTWEKEGAK